MSALRNRTDAGRRLAAELEAYRGRDDVVVLGLPRGGVPVAYEIARSLDAPLDVYIVRKLGVPGDPEVAMGAIASGGTLILNEEVIAALNVSRAQVEAVATRERQELQRREQVYRGDRAPLRLEGKIVILVDDGLATGASMKAAVRAVRASSPNRVVVAVGTAPPSTLQAFRERDDVDDVVWAVLPQSFRGVSGSYDDFSQTTDREVNACLDAVRAARV
jgi:predicted phosphoribosyltransferase